MIKDFKSIDDDLKHRVFLDYKKTRKISSLKEMYPSIDYNVLYSIIYSTGQFKKELKKQIHQIELNDKMIILISDTHDGARSENQFYKYQVFDFAVDKGVKTILHGGDFIQSYKRSYMNFIKEKDSLKQAECFVDYYPFEPNIMTYGIYGNHDHYAIEHDKKVRAILESREDIQVLGFKKAFILWNGYVISLQHEIDDFCLKLPVDIDFLSFGGHSHYYHIRKKQGMKCERIYMPAMCDFIPDPSMKMSKKSGIKTAPGFLTSEFFGDYILTTYYTFKNGTIVRENECIKETKTKKLIIK